MLAIATMPVKPEDVSRFGMIWTDENGRIVRFEEYWRDVGTIEGGVTDGGFSGNVPDGATVHPKPSRVVSSPRTGGEPADSH